MTKELKEILHLLWLIWIPTYLGNGIDLIPLKWMTLLFLNIQQALAGNNGSTVMINYTSNKSNFYYHDFGDFTLQIHGNNQMNFMALQIASLC